MRQSFYLNVYCVDLKLIFLKQGKNILILMMQMIISKIIAMKELI